MKKESNNLQSNISFTKSSERVGRLRQTPKRRPGTCPRKKEWPEGDSLKNSQGKKRRPSKVVYDQPGRKSDPERKKREREAASSGFRRGELWSRGIDATWEKLFPPHYSRDRGG